VSKRLAGFVFLVMVGCSADPGGSQGVESLVLSSDPELREVVVEILPDLARRTGFELIAPIRVERRSREELVSYLRYKLDTELPPEEAFWRTESYRLLGLFPEGMDLRALLLSLYTEQVAGFYEPDSTALFVMEDQATDLLRPVLVHELVHAVQDQHANLDSLTAKERGNDRQTAASAAIEGHATLVMLEYLTEMMQGQPVDFSELPNFADQIRPALESMRSQYPALASAPRVIQEALLFPYLEGAGYLQALWTEVEGRPAPFGPYLPQSTEQVLRPGLLLGDSPDPPTELEIELLSPGNVLFSNTLGELEVGLLLEEHLGPLTVELARGWDGDRYILIQGEDGIHRLIWASIWDGSAARDAFVEALAPALDGSPPVAALRRAEVQGRPVAILTVGEVGDHRVMVTEEGAR
jgi:hypothetical protein